MKQQLIWMTASLAALGAGVASAQYSTQPGYGNYDSYGQNVRCESNDSRTQRCRINGTGEVRLARQLSRTQCIQGRNWDYSRGEIRVTGGCRADFAVMNRDDDRYGNDDRYRRDDRTGNGYGREQVVHCDSRSSGRSYCGDADSQYTMVGYRDGNCIQGRTYGQDSRGLWVSGNCNAHFRRLGGDDRNDTGYGNGYGNQGNYAQTVRCISNSSGRSYCGDSNARYSLRDTSNRYCVEGRTYGTDSRGLWVSNPCQADFTRYPYQDNDSYRNGSYRDQPYYESERQRD